LPASRSPAARALARSQAEKLPHLLKEKIGARKTKNERQFFCEAGRRFAAAGGGLPQVRNF